jgi:hypothetical protein
LSAAADARNRGIQTRRILISGPRTGPIIEYRSVEGGALPRKVAGLERTTVNGAVGLLVVARQDGVAPRLGAHPCLRISGRLLLANPPEGAVRAKKPSPRADQDVRDSIGLAARTLRHGPPVSFRSWSFGGGLAVRTLDGLPVPTRGAPGRFGWQGTPYSHCGVGRPRCLRAIGASVVGQRMYFGSDSASRSSTEPVMAESGRSWRSGYVEMRMAYR